jgi:hypothetical protein
MADAVEEEVEVIAVELSEQTEVPRIVESKIKLDKKTFVLNSIRKALDEIEHNNIRIKKQQIFKALRNL